MDFRKSKISDPSEENEMALKKKPKQVSASLRYFLTINSRNCFESNSEIVWVTKDTMIATLNNEYFLIGLKHKDLVKVKNGIIYGK